MAIKQTRRDGHELPTVQASILAWLREALITGTLKPGDRIRQEALAETLGASLIPVREALKTLESEGQVTYQPRRGYYVTELRYEELVEIYEIRRILETETVRRALPNVDAETIATMRSHVEEVERYAREADVIGLVRANYEFHFTLYRVAASTHLVRLIELLWDSTSAYRARYFSDGEARTHLSHRVVLEAVEGGSEKTIVAALDAHRQQALDRLGAVLT
jgi:DNA-binding GntR family transcriptional regulator